MLITFNAAMVGGGAIGVVLVDENGPETLPLTLAALSAIAVTVVALGRTRAFPPR